MSQRKTRSPSRKGGLFPFIMGALFGLAVGGAAGVLLAPRSGAESRHIFSESIMNQQAGARKVVDESRHYAHKSSGDLVSTLKTVCFQFRDAVLAGKQAAKEKHQELQSKQASTERGKR
jgi:gas vesicle protein